MQLVLNKEKAGGRHKSRLQERFDKLRSTLERQRRRIDHFRQDLDELVDIYLPSTLGGERQGRVR
jgi:hypothetical protein